MGILVLAWSILSPVIGLITAAANKNDGGGYPMPMERYASAVAVADYKIGYPGGNGQEPITIDGVTIQSTNPFYWNLSSLQQERATMEADTTRFSSPEVLDLALGMLDTSTKYYLTFAQFVTKQQDYRVDLAYRGEDSLYDKYLYEHSDVGLDKLFEAASIRKGMDKEEFKKKFIDITPEAKLAEIDRIEENLKKYTDVAKNNDFAKYIDLRIAQENDQIKSLNEQIDIQTKAAIANPSQEENINQIISDLKKQIANEEQNVIPMLQFRLEKNIIPGEDIWQNNAISNIDDSKNQLLYTEITTEEKFNKDSNLVQQYGNYLNYKAKIQAQIDNLNNTILIAQNSLEAEKPDMKYVPSGARSLTVQFLDFSTLIALFAILLGGWIMASEFQQGTVRLLMIRPKTRVKILMAKFAASLVICLAIYVAGSIINMIVNGICFGFADFAFPNYTVSGEINFFLYYLPKFLACMVPIVFAFTVAFMLSTIVKNIAVSIAVPVACYILCTIAMGLLMYRPSMEWLAYTPIPYVQLSGFFAQYSTVQMAIQNGIALSLPYGIIMLLVLAAICTAISILVFKKRDITN
jgi:ABC-2 type transport system permease protein